MYIKIKKHIGETIKRKGEIMKQKIMKKIILILLLTSQILQITASINPSEAKINEGDIVCLQLGHACDSVLQYWQEDKKSWTYKEVWYTNYYDEVEDKKYPAFGVEPYKGGIGGKCESYKAMIEKEEDQRIWRILDKGYMGSKYTDWNLLCDDDLYTATQIAMHCLTNLDGPISPKEKYIVGTTSVDGNPKEVVKERGSKVLEIAQTLYDYGINGTDTYQLPTVVIQQYQEGKTEIINNTEYYVQNYEVKANRELKSYEVEIQKFPNGTKILDMNNTEQNYLLQNTFKIAIPISQIKQDINGTIIVKNAQIKTNPIFYCNTRDSEEQSYVTYVNNYETAGTSISLEIKANTCSLEIQKIDSQTKKPLENVTFEIRDEKQNKLGEGITNQNGIIRLDGIYPQTVTIKEIKVPEPYILSKEEKQVTLQWGKLESVTFENERKKGDLKIIKVDAENNEITLKNVEFKLFDSKGKLVQTLVTNEKGEAHANNLEIGTYTLKETKTNDNYVLNEKEITVEIKYGEVTTLKLENERIKGKIKIIKISEDDNLRNGRLQGSPIEGVIFQILDENKKVVQTLITNEEGIAISKELEKGIYTIREVKTHYDYEMTNEEFEVEIIEHESTKEITITNISKKPEEPKLPRTGF